MGQHKVIIDVEARFHDHVTAQTHSAASAVEKLAKAG